MIFRNTVTPVLTVRDFVRAVAFTSGFGVEIYRNTYPDGRIVAEMAVGGRPLPSGR